MINDTINIYTAYNISTNINVKIEQPETYTNRIEQLERIQKQLSIGLTTIEKEIEAQ